MGWRAECLPQMMAYSGVTAIADFNTVWENYIMEMTAMQKSLQQATVNASGRAVQLMAAINQYGSPIQLAAIAFEAQNAMSLGFGFGSQGLQGAT